MRVASVMPDNTRRMVSFECHIMRCPGCGQLAGKLVFARDIGPLAVEPMRLPASPPPAIVARVWACVLSPLRASPADGKRSISQAT